MTFIFFLSLFLVQLLETMAASTTLALTTALALLCLVALLAPSATRVDCLELADYADLHKDVDLGSNLVRRHAEDDETRRTREVQTGTLT